MSQPSNCILEKAKVLCLRISASMYTSTKHNMWQQFSPRSASDAANLSGKCNTTKMSISKGVSVLANDGWPLHQRHKPPCSGRIPQGTQPLRILQGRLSAAQSLPEHEFRHNILPTSPQNRIKCTC